VRHLTTLLVAGCFTLSAVADTIYAPPKAATSELPSKSVDTFGRGDDGGEDRFQQVYARKLFPGPEMITQIAFRADISVAGYPLTYTFPDVEFTLSTTSAQPGHLSSNLDSNLGPDETTVFSGSLTWTAPGPGPTALGPNPWYFVVNLATPFLYDPSKGNLLLNIENFADTVKPPVLDAMDTKGMTTSTVSQFDGDDVGHHPTWPWRPASRLTRCRSRPVSSCWAVAYSASGLAGGGRLGCKPCSQTFPFLPECPMPDDTRICCCARFGSSPDCNNRQNLPIWKKNWSQTLVASF
jgi:hypothetical protein